MQYRHTQPGTAMLFILLGGLLLLIFISMTAEATGPVWVVMGFIALIAVLFSSMTIRVDKSALYWHFGPGFWRKSVAVEQIVSARPIRTKWYYGLGIRLTPSGWLYIVSGLDAVEVTLDNGKIICLGTNDAGKLSAAINSVKK